MKNFIWALYKLDNREAQFIAAYPSREEAEQAQLEEHEGESGVTIIALDPPA